MSPDWQHCEPQQVVPEAHGCPSHGSGLHMPCAQKGVDVGQTWLQPPQFCGSFCESIEQVTPLQQIIPGWHVGQLPPPELLPLEEPLPLLLPELLEPPAHQLPHWQRRLSRLLRGTSS